MQEMKRVVFERYVQVRFSYEQRFMGLTFWSTFRAWQHAILNAVYEPRN